MKFADVRRALKDKHVILGFFSFLFLFLPGIAVIFVFDKNLFLTLDWIKLILLSASIMVPLAFWNTLLASALDDSLPKKDKLFVDFVIGLSISGVLLVALLGILKVYSWVLAGYFPQSITPLTFSIFLTNIVLIEIVGTALAFLRSWLRSRHKR